MKLAIDELLTSIENGKEDHVSFNSINGKK